MDEVYIVALVNQALGAYKVGGDKGLERFKQALPLPHREQFERDCGERLKEAIKALYPPLEPELEQSEDELPDQVKTQLSDPRKRHQRDRRRTKPL